MAEVQKITPEQWEHWRQWLLSKRKEGSLALVIYNPQTNQSIHMELPSNFAESAPSQQSEAYMLPALRQLGLSKAS